MNLNATTAGILRSVREAMMNLLSPQLGQRFAKFKPNHGLGTTMFLPVLYKTYLFRYDWIMKFA
jgi:hypothetical protein